MGTPTGSHIPSREHPDGSITGSAIGAGIGGYGGGSTYVDAPRAGTTGLGTAKRGTVLIAEEGEEEGRSFEEISEEVANESRQNLRRIENGEPENDENGKEIPIMRQARPSLFRRVLNFLRGEPAEVETPATMSMAARLNKIFARVNELPAARTAEEAISQMHKSLDEVENQYSGVPKASNPGLKSDGRMYPVQADRMVKGPDGTITATSRGHTTIYGPNGSITVYNRAGGFVVFEKSGETK